MGDDFTSTKAGIEGIDDDDEKLDFQRDVVKLIDLVPYNHLHLDSKKFWDKTEPILENYIKCTSCLGANCQRCSIKDRKHDFSQLGTRLYPRDMLLLLNANDSLLEAYGWTGFHRPHDAGGKHVFHLLCHCNPDLKKLRMLHDENPTDCSEALWEMADGQYPIHALLHSTTTSAPPSLAWLIALYNARSEASGQKMQLLWNEDNCLPIHVACQYNLSLSIIKSLVDNDGTVLFAPAEKLQKMLPVHLSCQSEHFYSLETIQFLVERAKLTLKMRNSTGATPLLLAARHGSVDVLQYLLKQDPTTASMHDVNKNYPLHVACIGQQPQRVIRILLSAYPEAAVLPNDAGYTPLHLCCQNQAPLDVIKGFVKFDKRLVHAPANNGHNVFLMAIKYGETKMVKYLITSFPSLVEEKYGTWLPLHFAVWNKAPKEIIKLLVQKLPEAKSKKDSLGRTPWDMALAKGLSDDLRALVKVDKGTVTTPSTVRRSKRSNGKKDEANVAIVTPTTPLRRSKRQRRKA